MSEKRNAWVYDFELVRNLLMLSAVHLDSDEKVSFVVWAHPKDRDEDIDELEPMIKWLEQDDLRLVGFNNVKFDYQIAHWLMTKKEELALMWPEQVIIDLGYYIQNEVLNVPFPPVPAYQMLIAQRDLFLIHHFDNKNKAVSLKALQIAMKWPNVMDMPFEHTDTIYTREQVEEMREYNFNDCYSTKAFYYKSLDVINLRHGLTEKYGIDLRNASDSKIGTEIILHEISKVANVQVKYLRPLRTSRPEVRIAECILPIFNEGNMGEFNKALTKFNWMVVTNAESEDDEQSEKKYAFSVLYDDMKYDFGIGGLHAVRPPGVYSADENFMIISADVTSYYPMWSLKYGFGPKHFGETYPVAYEKVFMDRKQYKKGTPENYGLKIALNGSYGNSRNRYSPLYDPMYTMQTTVNGQLGLALMSKVVTDVGSMVIMANTDGIEIMCPRSKEAEIRAALKAWSDYTQMPLEYKEYTKLFIRDVNNYIGVYPDGTTYNKGAYEWREYDEKGQKLLAWHKDHSMLAVPMAVENYLVRGIPIEQTFEEADFKMFYIGKRAKSGGKFEVRSVKGGNIETVKLNKSVRYLITKTGGYLHKGKSRVDSPWKVTLAMREPDPSIKSQIDYRYYKQEAIKLMKPILNGQINAFTKSKEVLL